MIGSGGLKEVGPEEKVKVSSQFFSNFPAKKVILGEDRPHELVHTLGSQSLKLSTQPWR